MATYTHDIIVLGCGSAGLSVGLAMKKFGFKVLMVSPTDHNIGGDCLNDGCVPSKSFIHVAKIVHAAKEAKKFGLSVDGKVDIKTATDYVFERQEKIRSHENAGWLRDKGIDLVLDNAKFTGKNEIEAGGNKYSAKKIVIATGSRPAKLKLPGIEKVKYYDNENIFSVSPLPEKLLVIGGGPIGMEMAQTLSRLGSKVTVVDEGEEILKHDDEAVTTILREQLEKEGLIFKFNSKIEKFNSSTEAVLSGKQSQTELLQFNAVLVAVGRELNIEDLQLEKAGIKTEELKILKDKYLRTTNKSIFVCGDVAGDLQFSHAAEFHARIILNNFFNPFKKKLDNKHMSWVTFTDPSVATFGYNEKQLKEKNIGYQKLDQPFPNDDRAVTDNYQYSKLILFISSKAFLKKQKILGGTMVAPNAGELIQEFILANTSGLSINNIFNKIYPYPTASRINQKAITQYRSKGLKEWMTQMLRWIYKVFG